ncbi:uncharacterized protein TNCV_217031 [Trichonephila clavipes]|nr:uncharacterized protein TNCV_217031 [Trichonephila clavipes]
MFRTPCSDNHMLRLIYCRQCGCDSTLRLSELESLREKKGGVSYEDISTQSTELNTQLSRNLQELQVHQNLKTVNEVLDNACQGRWYGFHGRPTTLEPLRHGVNEAINHEVGYFVPLFQKSSFQFLESLGGRPATRLPRGSKTCSIGFLSGEHAGHSIRTIHPRKGNPPRAEQCDVNIQSINHQSDCCSVRDYNRSEDLIPISASSQRSISNYVEVCAPVNGGATIHQHFPTAKSDTFVHERRIIPAATVPLDENTPIIRMNRKMGLVRKKNIAPFISPQFSCSVAHSLRSRRCLDISLTHTSGRRAYRPSSWSRFRTV